MGQKKISCKAYPWRIQLHSNRGCIPGALEIKLLKTHVSDMGEGECFLSLQGREKDTLVSAEGQATALMCR